MFNFTTETLFKLENLMKKSAFASFLFFKLPLAKLAGVRLLYADEREVKTGIKYKWLNQNPFKSMFWAAQGMAAELSTGTLCITKIRKMKQPVSMLVVKMEAEFVKKATGKITFTCDMGEQIDEILKKTVETGHSQQITLKSIGKNETGERVAEFNFTWSFKAKSA